VGTILDGCSFSRGSRQNTPVASRVASTSMVLALKGLGLGNHRAWGRAESGGRFSGEKIRK